MRTLIIANWKCNPQTLAEAESLFGSIRKGVKNIKNVETVICPPFVYLFNLKKAIDNLKLGAQDCFWEKAGAFTGEISPTMLKDLGCRYVILSHSEREKYFSETDEMTNKKIKAAILAKLDPIFCIGETEKEKERGETQNVLKKQIEKGLKGISEKEMENIILAYEPVWAIGTGNPCQPKDVRKITFLIRKIVSKIYSNKTSNNLKILYGGSVNSENVKDYLVKNSVNGFIIGGASLNSKEFIKIIKEIN